MASSKEKPPLVVKATKDGKQINATLTELPQLLGIQGTMFFKELFEVDLKDGETTFDLKNLGLKDVTLSKDGETLTQGEIPGALYEHTRELTDKLPDGLEIQDPSGVILQFRNEPFPIPFKPISPRDIHRLYADATKDRQRAEITRDLQLELKKRVVALDVIHLINSSTDFDTSLQRGLERICESLGADTGSIMLGETPDELEVKAAVGHDVPIGQMIGPHSIAEHIAETGGGTRLIANGIIPGTDGKYASSIVSDIVVGHDKIGFLSVAKKEGEFRDSDTQLVEFLSEHLTTIIEVRRKLKAFHDAGVEMADSSSIEDAFDKTIEHAKKAWGVESIHAYLVEKGDQGGLVLTGQSDTTGKTDMSGVHISINAITASECPIVASAFRWNENHAKVRTIHEDNGTSFSEAELKRFGLWDGFGQGEYIVVPLTVTEDGRKRVVGVITTTNDIPKTPVTQIQTDMEAFFAPLGPVVRKFQFQEGLNRHILQSLKMLQMTLDMKDKDMAGHSERVTEIADVIKDEMLLDDEMIEKMARTYIDVVAPTGAVPSELSAEMLERYSNSYAEDITTAAGIHDIGKVGIADEILKKEDRLTDEEFATMKTHASLGARMIELLEPLKRLVPLVKGHHLRVDGGGYAGDLAGEDIPVGASVLVIADCSDAIISARCYKGDATFEDTAFELMRSCGTGQFNINHMKYLIKAMARENEDGTVGFTTTYGQETTDAEGDTARHESKLDWTLDVDTARDLVKRMGENSEDNPSPKDNQKIRTDTAKYFTDLLNNRFQLGG